MATEASKVQLTATPDADPSNNSRDVTIIVSDVQQTRQPSGGGGGGGAIDSRLLAILLFMVGLRVACGSRRGTFPVDPRSAA